MVLVSKIKSGVSIPPKKITETEKHGFVYPFRLMKTGDSFLIECSHITEMDSVRRVITSCWKKAKRSGYGKEYTMRKMRDGNGKLLCWRVWRIE